MSCCVTKNYYSPQKKWILLLHTAEIRRKTQVRQPYCNLYAYGANNPVRYIDPDGNDIKEITLYSASIGAVGAVRFSLGVSIDSNGDTAVFAKFEFGIGAGTTVIDNSIAQIAELIDFGDLSSSVELLLSVIDFAEFVDNLPEDTGQGNLNDLPIADYLLNKIPVSKKFESIKDWKTFPVEGAVLIGAKGDKDGKVSFTFGLKGIASAFLCSETLYFKITNDLQE